MRLLLVLLLVPALLFAQDEKAGAKQGEKQNEKPKKKLAGDLDIPDPGAPIEDSATARQEVSLFHKGMRKAESDKRRIELLQRLGNYDHPEIVKVAGKYLKHKNHPVAIAAVVTCARQSKAKDKAGSVLLKQLKKEKRPKVVCALLIGMGKLGFLHKTAVKEAQKYHDRDTKETHKAATRYFGYVKYKPAFKRLASNLDEPMAKDPDDPTNPPASWWKERWMEWNTNVSYTRWALAQIVPGETFDSEEEAKQWALTVGREHGIEWK
ncbi:MAG: hypothetical protein ACYS0K_16070 [Planctomycetota bacterium]|jgi:hypothetical protein